MPGTSVELRVVAAGGRETRLRLAGWGGVFACAVVLALVAALVFGVVSVPAALSRSHDRKAMDIALRRRAQLGERLRALVERCETFDAQVRAHAERVERIRRLYDLPQVETAPEPTRTPRGVPSGIFAGAILYGERLSAAIDTTLSRTDALLAGLARWERDHPEEVRSVPVLSPLRGGDAVPIAGYGRQRNPISGEPELHAGIDFAAPGGAAIRASAGGVVRWAGEAPASAGEQWWRLGRIVVVAHGASFRTVYGHCDRVLVRAGQRVETGDPIALVGRSGWPATPRLHFEIRRRTSEGEWLPVDPGRLLLDGPSAAGELAGDRAHPSDVLAPPGFPRAFER